MLSSKACVPRIWEHFLGPGLKSLCLGFPACGSCGLLPDLGGTPWTKAFMNSHSSGTGGSPSWWKEIPLKRLHYSP